MNEFLAAIQAWLTPDRVAMLYYMFNCAVQSLPSPTPQDRWAYRWLFGWAHTAAGNVGLVRKRLRGFDAGPDLSEMQAQMDELRKLVESALAEKIERPAV